MMQKYRPAIPTRLQSIGFETDVVGRAFLLAREAGLHPVTAWLQRESNESRTLVSVVVASKRSKVIARLMRINKYSTSKWWKGGFPIERNKCGVLDIKVVTFGDNHTASVHKYGKNGSIIVFSNRKHV